MKSPIYLLKLEWLKYSKNILFLVAILLYAIALPGVFLGYNSIVMPDATNMVFDKNSFIQFNKIWDLGGYFGNWLIFFIGGFLGVVSISSEILYRTGRQQIISGLSRLDFLMGKFYSSIVFSLAFTLYYFIVTIITAYIITDAPGSFDLTYALSSCFRFFLMALSYFIFGQFLALLFKKNSLITMFFFIGLVMIIEPLLRWSVHLKIAEGRSFLFYPMNAIEDLTPMPFLGAYNEMMESIGFDIFLSPKEAIFTSLVYLSAYIILSWRMLRRYNI